LYYAALLDKTNVMAELQNAIDVYMADFSYYLEKQLIEGGNAGSEALNRANTSFNDIYNFITTINDTTTVTKSTLLTLEKTLEQYINNYFQYEQLFLKNITKFKEK
jgi:hypothetical protein